MFSDINEREDGYYQELLNAPVVLVTSSAIGVRLAANLIDSHEKRVE
jgi:hypothetical protein